MELSQHPFRNGENYDEQLGDVARRTSARRPGASGCTRRLPCSMPSSCSIICMSAGVTQHACEATRETGQRHRLQCRTARRHSPVGSARLVTRLTHPSREPDVPMVTSNPHGTREHSAPRGTDRRRPRSCHLRRNSMRSEIRSRRSSRALSMPTPAGTALPRPTAMQVRSAAAAHSRTVCGDARQGIHAESTCPRSQFHRPSSWRSTSATASR